MRKVAVFAPVRRPAAAAAIPLTLALALGSAGCGGGDAAGAPKPEVVDESAAKVDLPSVPEFEEPQGYPDGTHSVMEMRRKGKKFLDQNVKVKGYVVWVYDCAAVLGADVAKNTPEKCDRPNFYLSDTADGSHDKAIWVVEVPRPPRDDEKKFLPKEELKAWPKVPVLTVGQQVVVDGKWATRSPKGFVNSDGLLVYADLMPVDGGAPPAPPKK